MKKLSFLLVVFLFLAATTASAGLIGDGVYLSNDIFGNQYNSSGAFGSDYLEVADGSTWSFNNLYTVTFGDETLDFTFDTTSLSWADTGFKIDGIDTEFTVALPDGWTANVGTDYVKFNMGGLSFDPSQTYTATLTFAAGTDPVVDPPVDDPIIDDPPSGGDNPNTMANPVPAPILLLGTGLIGLAGFRRKK